MARRGRRDKLECHAPTPGKVYLVLTLTILAMNSQQKGSHELVHWNWDKYHCEGSAIIRGYQNTCHVAWSRGCLELTWLYVQRERERERERERKYAYVNAKHPHGSIFVVTITAITSSIVVSESLGLFSLAWGDGDSDYDGVLYNERRPASSHISSSPSCTKLHAYKFHDTCPW